MTTSGAYLREILISARSIARWHMDDQTVGGEAARKLISDIESFAPDIDIAEALTVSALLRVLIADVERLERENTELRHDLERSMANHVADINKSAAIHE